MSYRNMKKSYYPRILFHNKSEKRWIYIRSAVKTRPRGQRCVLKPLFHFSFFYNFFIFSLSSSLLPPRRSFLLVPLSFLSLFPPCPSFFLFQNCLNHLEFVKGHFSSILTKALRTNGPTNGPTDGRTRPLIEMRGRIEKVKSSVRLSEVMLVDVDVFIC